MEKSMKISSFVSKFNLALAISTISIAAFAQTTDLAMKDSVSTTNENTPDMREKAFKKQWMINEAQKVTYKKLVSEVEFESVKKSKTAFQFTAKQIGDVLVVQELGEDEIAFNKIKEFNIEKHNALIQEFKNTPSRTIIYKILTSVIGFIQTQEMPDKKVNFSKMMMSNGDDNFITMFIQQSAEEAAAEKKATPTVRLKIKAGDTFPAFSVSTTNSNTVDNSLFQGKITLMNFFFDKCIPCIKETPELNEFAKKHPNIQVLAVTEDSLKKATKYASEHAFSWNIASTDHNFLKEKLGMITYPSFALIDGNGKVLGISTGAEIPAYEGKVEQGLVEWITKLTDGKSL
jgi:peroxiredoxin